MVIVLNAVKLQADKTLVAASKEWFGSRLGSNSLLCLGFSLLRNALDLGGIVALTVEIVSSSSEDCCSSSIEKGV